LPADSGTFQLPVTLLNTDDILLDSTLTIGLKLVGTSDFLVEFPHLISAKISFSARLEEPDWWKYWQGELGFYSRTKHFLFLISSGTKALNNPGVDYLLTPKAQFNISEYKAFLTNPFEWATKHADYALDEQPDRNYHLYLKATPEKTYLLRWDTNIGKYFFIDENGEIIS
jgi:hypothetical protein